MRKSIWVVVGILIVGVILWVVLKPKHQVKEPIKTAASTRQPGLKPTQAFPLPVTIAGASGQKDYSDVFKKGDLKKLLDKYRKITDEDQRKEIIKQLVKFIPETREDMDILRNIFFGREWNEELFAIAVQMMKNIKNPMLAKDLIEILKSEMKFAGMAERGNLSGESEREALQRGKLEMFVIQKLGELKSAEAASILKEYLEYKSTQYYASESLGKMGDISASEEMRERAYKGEQINYGGLDLKEAKKVIEDLKDVDKKDKWPKIAKQLIKIENPAAKPYLKELFNHEDKHIRQVSASAYSRLVDRDNIQDIKEMAKSLDWNIRFSAIDSMKNVKEESFDKELIFLLINDPEYVVRSNAAKAIGYKHIAKSVPDLEKALNDKELTVRQNAFIALFILTGKKYDYIGKSSLIEWKAEDQKAHPTFY